MFRHTKGEDESLPFPSKIVGTYSCYGIEPVYELDDFHLGYNGIAPSPTAKINQDRGGVTFPYANCAGSALFAAYDGHGVGGELVSQFALHEIPNRLNPPDPRVEDPHHLSARQVRLRCEEEQGWLVPQMEF